MLAEKIETIIQKEEDIIPFLKTLTPTQKKELVPFLKQFKEKIFEHYEIRTKTKWGTSYTTKPKHSEIKRDLVNKACYVCFNKTDIKKAFFNVSQFSVSDDYLENIISWYKPKWYGDLINEDMPWELNYKKMMSLYKKELLQPSHDLILARLPHSIIQSDWNENRHTSLYQPEVLFQYPETLKEHIWFLFEEESGINNYYNYLHIENYKGGNDIWIDTITDLTNQHKLDRQKVLTATIYTSTKGFNKTLSGWFFDLLKKLNPSPDEILNLQNEFFSALNSPHSKVINTVLKYFKLVATHKKFNYKNFVENASILLNSETKSVVSSTLMILDKIAKTHKSFHISISKKAAEGLINIDEKTQLRAAKIIEKYGNPKDEELKDEVNLYAENILHSSKELLKDYLKDFEEIEDFDYPVEETRILSDKNLLPTYKTLDELIFFVSQSIDNNEVYHIDLLLSNLPKLNALLSSNNVAKLETIFRRCLDLTMNFEWSSQVGRLELETAFYINDFAEILMKKYPDELKNFRKSKDEKIKSLKKESYYSSYYKNSLKEIEFQSIPDYIYQIHRSLFIQSKSIIKKDLTLELLSTPTHSPCWINPKAFIDRIISYEDKKEEINLFDFQIALGRLPINEGFNNILNLLDKIVDSDIKKVLKYHFGLLDIKTIKINRPELWIQSVLSRNINADLEYFQENCSNCLQKEKGIYEWDCKLREHYYMDYDYVKRKNVEKKLIRKELKLENFDSRRTEADSIISNIKNLFSRKKKTAKINSFYKFMFFKKEKYHITIQPNDDIKFLFLSPNNPSMFLSQVIHNNLKESTFYDASGKKNMINLLKGLHQIWYRKDFKESTYLFLATGLLCSDKVSRELAAEIWIKTNAENKINNRLIGETIGKLELGEYAPLKRFTDLLIANLFNISKKHNKSLFRLLDHMISHMDKSPIRGLKKLLEIFLELKLGFTHIEISQSSKEKLNEWKEVKSLKPLISKLV